MPTKASIQKRHEKAEENLAQVYVDGKYSQSEMEKIALVCSQGISDPLWDGLKVKHKLPDRARGGVNSVIQSYWDFRSDIEIGKALAPKIEISRDEAAKLKELLVDLRHDRDFFKGVHAYYDQSPAEQSIFIEEVIGNLQKLELLLENARVRTATPAHRPSHRAIMQALRILAELMEIHGRELTADKDSIAYPILFLADPKLTQRMVRSVLKQLVSIRPLWSWSGVWVEDKFR